MSKSWWYRLLRIGGVSARARTELEAEGLELLDEGVPGRFMARNYRAPGKRYRHRWEGFSGWLAITERRIVAYTFGRRQIHIGVDDPRLRALRVHLKTPDCLCISFEAGDFDDASSGVLEFRFKTDQAQAFHAALSRLGAQPGSAA